METGRGKKSKKAAGQLTVRLVDVILAGIGVVVLMMLSFALGTLAGRGDIYRAAYSWGLLSPEAKHTGQIEPQVAMAPAPLPTAPPAAPAAPAAPPAVAPPPAAPAPPTLATLPGGPASRKAVPAHNAVPKSAHPAPVTASMTPVPPPAAAASTKKKAKSALAQHEQKVREEQLRQHQDLAKKMTFLNSFDTTPKFGQKKEKDKTKAAIAKPAPTQVRVATYRDSKTAQAKLAELHKQGVKATVKPGKDAKGCACYTVYRQPPAPAHPKEPEKVAQSKEKTGAPAPTRKPQPE